VTDIMSDIAAASAEQSAGIEQVNLSIIEMDSMTQQNASLVEEAAAAAQSLQDQAGELARVVSIFKLDEAEEQQVAAAAPLAPALPAASNLPAVRPPAARRAGPRPGVKKPATAARAEPSTEAPAEARPKKPVAAATAGDEWEEF
jgi:methyl-accepting chemotaxis protein